MTSKRCRCGKVWAPTSNAAQRLHQLVVKRFGPSDPVRFYRCKYASWHWTRKEHGPPPTAVGVAYEKALAEYREVTQEREKELPVDGVQIEWVDEVPDVVSGRVDENNRIVAELKKRPGQWARVAKNARYSGPGRPWKNRGCEVEVRNAVNRKPGERSYDVYARWPGQQVPAVIVPSGYTIERPQPVSEVGGGPDGRIGLGATTEGFVEDHGTPVRDLARQETEEALVEKEPEDVGDDNVRKIIREGKNGWKVEVEDGKATLSPPVPTAPRQASEEELQRNSAALASGEKPKQAGKPPKAKVAPGRPRRMATETEAAYQFRLKRWERNVPPEGKALPRR